MDVTVWSIALSCIGTVIAVIGTHWYKYWKVSIKEYSTSLIEHEWNVRQNIYLLHLLKANKTNINIASKYISLGKPYTMNILNILDDSFRMILLQHYNMMLEVKINSNGYIDKIDDILKHSTYTLDSIIGNRKLVKKFLAKYPLLFYLLPILLDFIQKKFLDNKCQNNN